MEARVEWFFDGLGTLLIGLIVGGAGGGIAGWRIGVSRTTQRQKAGDSVRQTQAGRDVKR